MMFHHTNPGQKPSNRELTFILSLITLIAFSCYFLTSWSDRGLIMFVVYPMAFITVVLWYHSSKRRNRT